MHYWIGFCSARIPAAVVWSPDTLDCDSVGLPAGVPAEDSTTLWRGLGVVTVTTVLCWFYERNKQFNVLN